MNVCVCVCQEPHAGFELDPACPFFTTLYIYIYIYIYIYTSGVLFMYEIITANHLMILEEAVFISCLHYSSPSCYG